MTKVFLCLGPVPLVAGIVIPERTIWLGQRRIKFNCFLRKLLGPHYDLSGVSKTIRRNEEIGIGIAGIGEGEIGIKINRLLKIFNAFYDRGTAPAAIETS